MSKVTARGPAALSPEVLAMLCSPRSRLALRVDGDALVSIDGSERYRISRSGVPQFAAAFLSDAGRDQQHHYDGMVAKYVANLSYPHTQEYTAYLDRQLLAVLPDRSLGT